LTIQATLLRAESPQIDSPIEVTGVLPEQKLKQMYLFKRSAVSRKLPMRHAAD
jgi:hypothetical protein